MKKIIIRMLTVLIYIIALLSIVRFKFAILFDLKLILMVTLGTMLLTLSSYKKGMMLEEVKASAAWNAVITAYLTTFVLLFTRLSNNSTSNLLYDVAMNCRPLLYGLIINILLKNETMKTKKASVIIDEEQGVSLEENWDLIAFKLKEAGMTDREIEIAEAICNGLSNKEIGEILYISETTVKKHTSNLYKKLNLNNREQLKQFIQLSCKR